MSEPKIFTGEARMHRRYFVVNTLGESEFDYLLREIGVPEDQIENIDEIVVTELAVEE